MKLFITIVVCAGLMPSMGAEPAKKDHEALIQTAQQAGIDQALVLDPQRRPELVKALRGRIVQGYVDEQAYKAGRWKFGLSAEQQVEVAENYYNTRATGFESALKVASECKCIELVPLLIELGDMRVLAHRGRHYMDAAPRSVKAIAAMAPEVTNLLFDIIDDSPKAGDRYYALAVLGLWKHKSGEELAKRMEVRCDTSNINVKLALAFLRGEILLAEHAQGVDTEQ